MGTQRASKWEGEVAPSPDEAARKPTAIEKVARIGSNKFSPYQPSSLPNFRSTDIAPQNRALACGSDEPRPTDADTRLLLTNQPMHPCAGEMLGSLGIIMLEAITGKNPMHLIGDHRTLGYQLVQGKIPIPDSVPSAWRNLLRGLLEADYSRRWDAEKIRRWLTGTTMVGGASGNRRHGQPLILLLLTAGIIFVCVTFAIEGFRTGGFGILAPASSQDAGCAEVTGAKKNPPNSAQNEPKLGNLPTPARAAVDQYPILTIVQLIGWMAAGTCIVIGAIHLLSGVPHGAGLISLGLLISLLAARLPAILAFLGLGR